MKVDQNKRQQIYDKIKESSRDEYILSEMKRLGFWNTDEEKPSLPEAIIAQEAELLKKYRELVAKQRNVKDKESFLKTIRAQKIKESRQRQAENKEKRKQERIEKAQKWQEFKKKEILYLGKDVSGGLNNKEQNSQRLSSTTLPAFKTVEELAQAIGISVNELRFLTFDRKTSKVNHYQRFLIKKKTGGTRLISAPKPRLKNLQYWVLENILNKITIHSASHGFTANKSIVTNAEKHVDKKVVINIDLKNFFPTITYNRIKGMFKSFGYSEQIATVLALICSEPDVAEIDLDDENYFVAKSPRYLPQGAPTSPIISNIICKKLDARIEGLAKKKGFAYTRYADDMTLSSNTYDTETVKKLLAATKTFVKDENFVIHPDKLRVMHAGRRQEVTGIVVNKTKNISKKELKNFRALLFQIEKDGIEGKVWRGKSGTKMLYAIKGYAEFIKMVHPEKGETFVQKVQQIFKANNMHKTPKKSPTTSTATQETQQADNTQKTSKIKSLLNKLMGGKN